jgi:hypothetical protein
MSVATRHGIVSARPHPHRVIASARASGLRGRDGVPGFCVRALFAGEAGRLPLRRDQQAPGGGGGGRGPGSLI